MRILSILGGDKGLAVFNYRVRYPLSRLAAKHTVQWVHFNDLHTVSMRPDIIVLNRPVADETQIPWIRDEFVPRLRSTGATIVMETDDDYITLPSNGRTSLPYLPYIDAITVSTNGLKRLYSQYTDADIYVLPNALDTNWFSHASLGSPREDSRITVGLVGTESHYDDWLIMVGVMSEVLSRYDSIRFVCAGTHPDYLDGIAEFIDGAPYPQYPGVLRQVDILCCPLTPEKEFNYSKSPVKALEGWAAARILDDGDVGGCAVLAARQSAYKGTVQHKHNGLLVPYDVQAWIDAVSLVVERKFQRLKFQREGFRDVRKFHDIEKTWKLWDKAYTSIRSKHIGGSR